MTNARTIIETFCCAANTFITPNAELGFSLQKITDAFDLPIIIGEFYEDIVPHNSCPRHLSEEFLVVFYQLFALINLSHDTHGKTKTGSCVCNMTEKKKDQGISFFSYDDVLKRRVVTEDRSSSSPKQITNFVNYSDLEVDLEEASRKYAEAETCDNVFGRVAFKRHLC